MALSKIQTGLVDANAIGATELSSPLNLSSKTLNISNVNNTFPAGHVVQTVYNSPGTTVQISLGSSSTPSFTTSIPKLPVSSPCKNCVVGCTVTLDSG